MLPLVLLLALSGAVVTAKGPGGWLYTKRNCVTAPPDVNGNPNLELVNYSRRQKLNGNKCLKQEGQGGYEAQRRLSLWLSASEDERTGCLWAYTNDDCTEGEQSMSYKLKATSDTCWTFDPSTMGSNDIGYSSYWFTDDIPCPGTLPNDSIDVHE